MAAGAPGEGCVSAGEFGDEEDIRRGLKDNDRTYLLYLWLLLWVSLPLVLLLPPLPRTLTLPPPPPVRSPRFLPLLRARSLHI